MKKFISFLLLLSSIALLFGCSATDKSNNTSILSSDSPPFSMKDITWNAKEGILNEERYVLLNYTNNTDYAITYFKLKFKAKENLPTEETEAFYSDMKKLWNYTDSKLGEMIPKPTSPVVKLDGSDDENSFWFDAYDISYDEFEDYVEECKKRFYS